jgi:hypothetical protein
MGSHALALPELVARCPFPGAYSIAVMTPLPPYVLRASGRCWAIRLMALTGREIAALLRDAHIDDAGEMTKKDRLFEPLNARKARVAQTR